MGAKQGCFARGSLSTNSVILLVGLALSLWPSAASAAPDPSLFWRVPEDGNSGPSAGQLESPSGIAVDPATGNSFVMDQSNQRVDEFDPWGQFLRAWGWGVRNGASEFQICTAETGCQEGIGGAGPGQFDRKLGGGGIAVGPEGSVYVGDPDNYRVEKFDSSGSFLLEFGEEGTGPGQLKPGTYLDNLAAGPDGTVYLGEEDRVQVFEPDGTFKEEIPFEGDLDALKDREFRDLATDGAGNLYATVVGLEEVVKFSPAGNLVAPESFPLTKPRNVAIDNTGNLYTTKGFEEVVVFDANAQLLIPPESNFGDVNLSLVGLATSSACGIDGSDLFVLAANGTTKAFVSAYGPPPNPDLCPQPPKPPTILRQFAREVSPESAELSAEINPHFWPDTSFYVEYGQGKCSEGGCTLREPSGDQLLTNDVVDRPITGGGITLPGLTPDTEYHFRFVAQSGGGGPVFGADPDGEGPEEATETEGAEGSFKSFPGPPTVPACPNDAFRIGPAKVLSHCRAYEMVSPIHKEGGEIFTLFNSLNERASLNQSSLSGDRVTYSSFRAFADPKSAPATLQYMGTRLGNGWSSRAISPPRGTPMQKAGQTLESQFRAFSGDLCIGWLVHDTDPPLAPEAAEGFPGLYKTNLCDEEEEYEALTTVAPPGQDPTAYRVNPQGFSADGSHTVFRASGKLTGSASENTNYQCYEHFGGKLRLVSVLPSGLANPSNCSIGIPNLGDTPHAAQVQHAVSEDGSRIYWTAWSASDPIGKVGKIYLRENAKNPTLEVSMEAEALSGTPNKSHYWTAASDGSKAIFSTGNLNEGADAYEYRVADKSTHLIAHKVRGYLGASEDASVIYLASEEVLAGPNSEDKSPSAGEPNLYRYEVSGESFSFIGTLSEVDADTSGLSPLANPVSRHTARVSADGRIAAFMSTEALTGFDNTDANSGEPDTEVFRYDAAADGGGGRLVCVSCSPTGIAPTGRVPKWGEESLQVWVAAQLPSWEAQLAAPRVLPEEGERVLFESYEPLVARDNNHRQDVYEWSAAGAGDCQEESFDYSPPNGGCLNLISSGESTRDSEFVDASADGRDVFFTTASSLVPQDPGLIDLYDAREGGGFPPPPAPKIPCDVEAEACQHPGLAPGDTSPASQQPGPGNVKPRPRCHKGRVYSKKKKRCVRKHRRHNMHRRASR